MNNSLDFEKIKYPLDSVICSMRKTFRARRCYPEKGNLYNLGGQQSAQFYVQQ